MIDESPAGEEFKRGQRAKLDALLALAEAHDCRRVRLLAYFGEESSARRGRIATTACTRRHLGCHRGGAQGAVLHPTASTRTAASVFGAGHLIDVLRGKRTDKVAQHRHAGLSTFDIGADLSETQWRAVLRQLIALGHLRTEGEYNTLELMELAEMARTAAAHA